LGGDLLRILGKGEEKKKSIPLEGSPSHIRFSLPCFKLVALPWSENSLKFRDTRTQNMVKILSTDSVYWKSHTSVPHEVWLVASHLQAYTS